MKQSNQGRIFIYDLDQPSYLEEDINEIFSRISELYDVQLKKNNTIFIPKTTTKYPFASNESADDFNKLVPKLKSLIKDMYSIIEGVYKAEKGEFKKLEAEQKYEYLKEFRILNNKLKHHNDREAKITLTAIMRLEFDANRLDCHIQFWYPKEDKRDVVAFSELVLIFLKILEDKEIIEIERKN